jgi:hypothetical protein
VPRNSNCHSLPVWPDTSGSGGQPFPPPPAPRLHVPEILFRASQPPFRTARVKLRANRLMPISIPLF